MPVRIVRSESIEAPPERVWRALCDPAEVVNWDASVLEALDAPADYPQPGQHVRWRCRDTTTLLHDRPQAVQHGRLLRSLLDFGRQHLDETYRLSETPSGTRIDLEILLTVRVPLAGPLLARLRDAAQVNDVFQASLRNLKFHCESDAAPGGSGEEE